MTTLPAARDFVADAFAHLWPRVRPEVRVAAARDFVADAFAHCKFIAHAEAAMPLLGKVGLVDSIDDGFVTLKAAKDREAFVEACRKLRF